MMATENKLIQSGLLAPALILAVSFLLPGCGGESTKSNPVTTSPNAGAVVTTYAGPAPTTADIQAFKLNVWDNLVSGNRCGSCHSTGGQSPTFVRMDNINLAYAQAGTIVNPGSPADSRMVTKVAGGHNCWLASNSACGDVITAYIEAWLGGSVTNGNQITLTAPTLYNPSDSRSFPADSGLFASTVHPLLIANCAACHVESAPDAQSPFFADLDADAAYEAAKSKMNLDVPGDSRFVVRLLEEFHNCWDPNGTGSPDCAASSIVMENAIATFAGQVPLTQVDPQLVTSMALRMPDGIVASGGSRHEENVIALYEFKTGQGTTVFDTSGVSPDLHLTLSGNVSWVGGYGIDITGGKAQGPTSTSRKLYDLITATGEYSIEGWVVPANVSQDGPARIISYSAGTTERNFTLGQTLYNYDYLHRSTTTDANGEAALSTADADEDLQATLQHVVVTFDPANGRRIYVNGVSTEDIDPVPGGTLIDWDNSFAFVLGNEVSGDRQWQGKLRLVAIHNRALTEQQIVQNFSAGVGEKYYLLFSVTDSVGIPDSYVLIEVSQFDNHGYLFNTPIFISLDPTANPDNIPIAGMRIGINGKEAVVGQAYSNLDTVITSAAYDPATGQILSDLGTVIALEKGPDLDEFFLTFEVLGNNTNIKLEPAPLIPAPPADLPEASDIGLRMFDEINATMAAVTGVETTQAGVRAVFNTVRQQLPTVENIEGFLSAQQMAISQLAIEYCSALVDNNGQELRSDYFPGLFIHGPTTDQADTADTAFDTQLERNLVIDPLLSRIAGTGLTTQPDFTDMRSELDDLVVLLSGCALGPTPGCATRQRSEEIVKAACAATLGSAAMLLQ